MLDSLLPNKTTEAPPGSALDAEATAAATANGKPISRAKTKSFSQNLLLSKALQRLRSTTSSEPGSASRFTFHNDPYLRTCEIIAEACGIPLFRLTQQIPDDPRTDPIAAIAEACEIRYRYITLRNGWQSRDCGALVGFFRDTSEPVPLVRVGGRRYRYYDFAAERFRPLTKEILDRLEKRACVLYRSFPAKILSLFDVLKFGLHGCRPQLRRIIFLGILETVLYLLGPMSIGLILNDIVPGAERVELIQLGALLVAATLGGAALMAIRSQTTLGLETRMSSVIQSAVWNRMLSLPVSFFRKFGTGELAQRSLGISKIQETLTSTVITSMLSGIISLCSVVLLFYYSWQFALEALLIIAISVLIMIPYALSILKPRRLQMELQVGVASKVLQLLNGIAKLRVVGAEGRAFALWANDFALFRKMSVLAHNRDNRLEVMFSLVPTFCEAAICAHFGIAILIGKPLPVSTGSFIAFIWTLNMLLHGINGLRHGVLSALSVIPLYEAAKPILLELPESTSSKANPGPISGAIVVRNLSFRYLPERQPVIRNISLEIEPGEFVAVAGASGSGKSTLIRLLLGFETPESGSILYDHYDTKSINMQSLRRQLGVVLQGGRLQNQSLLRCIIGSAPLSRADAWEAAAMAGLDEDIRQMPMGLDTRVGEGGCNLSGGQRQRLMIARALVGKPKILFLDEATSALDNHTQSIVSQNLGLLNTTRIVIAHRLSTIQKADRIYVLKDGVLVECGRYHDLIGQDSILRQLLARQL